MNIEDLLNPQPRARHTAPRSARNQASTAAGPPRSQHPDYLVPPSSGYMQSHLARTAPSQHPGYGQYQNVYGLSEYGGGLSFPRQTIPLAPPAQGFSGPAATRHGYGQPQASSSRSPTAQCMECGRGFTNAEQYRAHYENYHSKVKPLTPRKKPFKCNYCTKAFEAQSKLSAHISAVHEGRRPYTCQCGKSFAYKGDLSVHIKSVHQKVKKHICFYCGTGFYRVYHLKRHLKLIHDKAGK